MSGDVANSKDDDLLNQIDELKARMDRLMAGGTSTSNSALLTDAPRSSSSVVEAKPAAEPPPPRTRVGDLIGPTESDALGTEDHRRAVPFPDESAGGDETRPADRPDDRPTSSPPPNKPPTLEGSLIAVDDKRDEPRPKVQSFDELGSAVEQELARDTSVPPASARRGPDLASRFGPVDEPVEPKPEEDISPESADAVDEPVDEDEVFEVHDEPAGRRNVGALVAIWIFTVVTSCGIAVLHFTGVI